MNARLLLAFADPLMLAFYAEFLGGRQFAIRRAQTAEAALALACAAALDLIIIDGVGIKRRPFCRDLTRILPTRTIPVIALVQSGANQVPAWARGTMCETGLTMPCLPEALLEEIDRQLTRAARSRRRTQPA